MQAISFSTARAELKATLDRVCRDRTPVTIIRQRGEPVVVMSLDDYNGLMETLHLLRSPANADRLLGALADARAGRGLVEQPLVEE